MEALISVIIPVYNMEQYLARCLDSILANTYQNLEILCVDDGSRDRSLEILRQYAEKDSRIVVIAKENGGVSSARNAGLDRMTGAFVSFIDPDDFVHPQYFELLLRAQQEADADVTICAHQKVGEDEPMPDRLPLTGDPQIVSLSCQQVFRNKELRAYCWAHLFRFASLNALRFRETIRYAEDALFLAELWERNTTLSCGFIDEKLYYYYQRSGSLVNMSKERDRLIVEKIFAGKAGLSERNEQIYLEQTLRRLLNSRYYAKHIYPDSYVVRETTHTLRSLIPVLKKSAQLPRNEKLRYALFARVPGAYWLFRVTRDPSMWKWEKAERKKRRAEKHADRGTKS